MTIWKKIVFSALTVKALLLPVTFMCQQHFDSKNSKNNCMTIVGLYQSFKVK